jgi:hypothetical protein
MSRERILAVVVCVMIVANIASATLVQDIDIDFVTIGNAGNAADTQVMRIGDNTTGYGAVGYEYLISKYEITNVQWNAFIAATGAPTGNPADAYDESATYPGVQQPANNISWYEALQFCNYLTSGDKSKGVYQFSGDNANPGDFLGIDRAAAQVTYGNIYFLPTEDEWYKAAYYKPDGSGYSIYSNGTNTRPIADNGWNYHGGSYTYPWDVGTGTMEQNGTFDMMGNVYEWNESLIGSFRGIRGGASNSSGDDLASWDRSNLGQPFEEYRPVGFRVASLPFLPTIIYVNDDSPNDPVPYDASVSDPNENGTPEHPFDMIQEGIDAAEEGDTVIIDPGVYTGDGNRDLDFKGKAITLRSIDPNDPDIVAATIINCNGSVRKPHRGFRFHSNEDANSVLNGLTIINGYGLWDFGGAILCQNSSPSISNCNFVNNFAVIGGGAIENEDDSNPILSNCVFRQNSADWGGAIRNHTSSPVLINCLFAGNFANAAGGGIENEDDSNPMLLNCVFHDNSSDWIAGALRNHTSSPLLINCLFTGNYASLAGGAIQNENDRSNPILINCTFTGNTASGWAGGILVRDSKPAISNCIFWGNSDGNGTNESAQIYGGSPVINYSCVQGWRGGLGGVGNIRNHPRFVNPRNGDYHLMADSACVDAGDNAAVTVDIDLDGNTRIANGIVDMGAYEFFPAEPADLVDDLGG